MKLIELVQVINSYGAARATGDAGLIKLAAEALQQKLSRLPEELPEREPETMPPPEPQPPNLATPPPDPAA
jgi:hypothetical protein